MSRYDRLDCPWLGPDERVAAEIAAKDAEIARLRAALFTLRRATDHSAPGASDECPHGFCTFNMCGLCDDEAKDVARAALQEQKP